MDAEELVSKVRTALSKGAADAKNVFEKAGDKVQKFSDKSVVLLEKKKIETKRNAKYKFLGEKLSEYIFQEKLKLPKEIAAEVESALEEIKELTSQIQKKDELLSNEEA